MAEVDDLASKSCTPCQGGVPPLGDVEVAAHLRRVPRWSLRDEGRRIERQFRFATFAEAFAFVGRVAGVAEAEQHHPDIAFGWGYATISLQTHAIKGLHANDFIVAAKVDQLPGPEAEQRASGYDVTGLKPGRDG